MRKTHAYMRMLDDVPVIVRARVGKSLSRRVLAWVAAGSIAVAATAVAVTFAVNRSPAGATIAWPQTGAAAMSWDGQETASPDADEAFPIGSLTKLVTVLVSLDRVPLAEDSRGPTFALTDDDARFAQQDPGRTESLITATAGETLSMRTLIEYALVTSSNTHARALALRLFGDEASYLSAARDWLDDHGLEEITVADANGISLENTATVGALVRLGRIADEDPIIRNVVTMPGVLAPDGRWVESVNDLLGTQGIDGLKTGHPTDGTYAMVFSADRDGTRVIGSVVGSPSVAQRSTDVIRLLAQVEVASD